LSSGDCTESIEKSRVNLMTETLHLVDIAPGSLVFSLRVICYRSIEVGVCKSGVNLYGFAVIGDSLVILALFVIGKSPVSVGFRKLRADLCGLAKIRNSLVILASTLSIGNPSTDVGTCKCWIYRYGLVVMGDSLVMLAYYSIRYTLK
jgi:hypothetical protein